MVLQMPGDFPVEGSGLTFSGLGLTWTPKVCRIIALWVLGQYVTYFGGFRWGLGFRGLGFIGFQVEGPSINRLEHQPCMFIFPNTIRE